MITLKNIRTLSGNVKEHLIESTHSQVIDGQNKLLMLPALIDLDASFDRKEWTKQALSFLPWGITTVFEAEGEDPDIVKKQQEALEALFKTGKTPLRLHCFLNGNDPQHFESIGKTKSYTMGIKVSYDLTKASISAPHKSALDRLFQVAAQNNRIVVFALMQGKGDAKEQRKTAYNAVENCIVLAQKYSAQLCLQHLRTKEEMDLIRKAKEAGILVYAEVSYPHLLFTDQEAKVDAETSFFPSRSDQDALWEAVNNRTIDLIGSGSDFRQPELLLTALIDAAHNHKMPLEKVISLTRQNVEDIFSLPPNKDVVLVDMDLQLKPSSKLISKQPLGEILKNKLFTGWPVYTIANGHIFASGLHK